MKDTLQKELAGASTAVVVLAVLGRGANYGYEIVRQVNAEADGAFTWQEGTVYPVLHKLERQELIKSDWREVPSGRRRKYYRLTAAGRAALGEGTRQWELFNRIVVRLSGAAHA